MDKIAILSEETKNNITKEMQRFENYEKFLESVFAMRNGKVLMMNLTDQNDYEQTLIKHFYNMPLNDSMYFSETSAVKEKKENEKKLSKTGKFVPRMFWDKIEKERDPFGKGKLLSIVKIW